MFDDPQYMRSTIGLTIPEIRSVGNWERQIFLKLRDFYFPAKLAVAPESSPDAPALLFQSQHGHSQIVIGSSNLVLSVAYSAEWQKDPTRAREYVTQRSGLLFDLLKVVGSPSPLYWGVVTQVKVPWNGSDVELLGAMARVLDSSNKNDQYHDFATRTTTIVQDAFFCNTSIQSYRGWTSIAALGNTFRLSRNRADERGAEITVDYNSRYSFNEDKPAVYTKQSLTKLIDEGMSEVEAAIQMITGGAES